MKKETHPMLAVLDEVCVVWYKKVLTRVFVTEKDVSSR